MRNSPLHFFNLPCILLEQRVVHYIFLSTSSLSDLLKPDSGIFRELLTLTIDIMPLTDLFLKMKMIWKPTLAPTII